MTGKGIAAAAAILALAAGCDDGRGNSRKAATPVAAGVDCPDVPAAEAPSGVTSRDRTMFGQLLKLPPPPPPGPAPAPAVQVVLSVKCFSHPATIARHKHPWQRYVYLESGSLTVIFDRPLQEKKFKAGELLVESTDTWHSVQVDGPAKLIVIDQLPAADPPGSNVIPYAEPDAKAAAD